MSSVYTSFSDIFRIGVGPSSSHTVGPMRAARYFVSRLEEDGLLKKVQRVQCQLQGSLGATGRGHHTPNAIMAGLQGFRPNNYSRAIAEVKWDDFEEKVNLQRTHRVSLPLLNKKKINFFVSDISFNPEISNEFHPNCLILRAFSDSDAKQLLREETYLSPGGGAIQIIAAGKPLEIGGKNNASDLAMGYIRGDIRPDFSDFSNATELLRICGESEMSIADVAKRQEILNSDQSVGEETVNRQLDQIWEIMNSCIDAGLSHELQQKEPMISKPLTLPRRAPAMYAHLKTLRKNGSAARSEALSCYAIAVNEQNASGERIVTAPTAGAAGVIPAVLRFWVEQSSSKWLQKKRNNNPLIREFILTAAAIGSIIKANGSISGAECGCQAEIGSACAMAAAGLTHLRGGTPSQVENAAEIALEYHLGLTCDPVGGLVLIPCIERNAMAANTAVTAAELALAGNGTHRVSLDTAIETMRQTGIDMNSAYKETSRAGLATTVHC